MGRRGQYNGVNYGYTCPFCGSTYGITNFSRRDPPPGAERVSPDPPRDDYAVHGPGMWTPHTVRCWTEQRDIPNERRFNLTGSAPTAAEQPDPSGSKRDVTSETSRRGRSNRP